MKTINTIKKLAVAAAVAVFGLCGTAQAEMDSQEKFYHNIGEAAAGVTTGLSVRPEQEEAFAQFELEAEKAIAVATDGEGDAIASLTYYLPQCLGRVEKAEDEQHLFEAYSNVVESVWGTSDGMADALRIAGVGLLQMLATRPTECARLNEAHATVVETIRRSTSDVQMNYAAQVGGASLLRAIAQGKASSELLTEAYFMVLEAMNECVGYKAEVLYVVGNSLLVTLGGDSNKNALQVTAFSNMVETVKGCETEAQARAFGPVCVDFMNLLASKSDESEWLFGVFSDVVETTKGGLSDDRISALAEIDEALFSVLLSNTDRSLIFGAYSNMVEMVMSAPSAPTAYGTIGARFINAFTKYPKKEEVLSTILSNVVEAVSKEGLEDSHRIVLATVGTGMMDAIYRNHSEALGAMASAYSNVVETVAGATAVQAEALQDVGCELMSEIMYSQENAATFLEGYSNAVEMVTSCPQGQEMFLGQLGYYEIVARSSAISAGIGVGPSLQTVFSNVSEIVKGRTTLEVSGMVQILEGLMYAIGFYPEECEGLWQMAKELCENVQGVEDELQMEFLGCLGGDVLLVCGRNLDLSEGMMECFYFCKNGYMEGPEKARRGIYAMEDHAIIDIRNNPNAEVLAGVKRQIGLFLDRVKTAAPFVRIRSVESTLPGGTWDGGAKIVYRLFGLVETNAYALATEMTAAKQFGAVTNGIETADGFYTNTVNRVDLFGTGSTVEDRKAQLTLKLIEK